MQNIEYPLEFSIFDEDIANKELLVAKAQESVSNIKLERAHFVRSFGEALIKSKKILEIR